MLPAGFEPATPASERPHIHALGRAASGTGRFRNRNTELSRNNQRTIHFAEPTKNVMFCTFAPPPSHDPQNFHAAKAPRRGYLHKWDRHIVKGCV